VVAVWSAFVALGFHGAPARWTPVIAAGLSLVCGQISIAAINDLRDLDYDRRYKPHKPLARAHVTAAQALAIGVGAGVACPFLAIPAGALQVGFACLGLACGQAYNLWLKPRLLSAVPFVIALPSLAVAALSLSGFSPRDLLLYVLGLPISLAVHLNDAAPGVGNDRLAGWRGLPQRLGDARSFRLGLALLGLSVLLALFLGASRGRLLPLDLPLSLFGASLGAAALRAWSARGPVAGHRLALVAQVVVATAAVAGWL
jgi:4-hydroxybenzoate polyprenyltransferase